MHKKIFFKKNLTATALLLDDLRIVFFCSFSSSSNTSSSSSPISSSADELVAFVEGLDIGADAKARLVALTPATYTGLADRLVDEV